MKDSISRSLAQGPTPCVTLYVPQNGTVPEFVVNRLLDVRARLAQIKTLPAKSEISWGHRGLRGGTEGDG